MQIDSHAIRNTIETLEQELLKARNPAGYWEGYLSSSALSTATAVFALAGFILKQSKPNNISSSDKNEAIKDFVSRGVT